MSHIPNSAMPHAGEPSTGQEQSQSGNSTGSAGAFSQLADKAREYPKTAIAAGAAVAAGVVAAATIGVRGRRGGNSSGSGSGSGKKG